MNRISPTFGIRFATGEVNAANQLHRQQVTGNSFDFLAVLIRFVRSHVKASSCLEATCLNWCTGAAFNHSYRPLLIAGRPLSAGRSVAEIPACNRIEKGRA